MAAMNPLRCPRPQCRKKMGDDLDTGTYRNQCPRCRWFVTITRRDGKTVLAKAAAPVIVDNQRIAVIYRNGSRVKMQHG